MYLDDQKIKELLNRLELSNDEKSWIRDCIKKSGSIEKAKPLIRDFIKHKMRFLTEDLREIEEEREKIQAELNAFRENFMGQTEKEVKRVSHIRIDNYKKIKSRERQKIEKIILYSENAKRKMEAYKLKFRTEKEGKQLADIRKKLL